MTQLGTDGLGVNAISLGVFCRILLCRTPGGKAVRCNRLPGGVCGLVTGPEIQLGEQGSGGRGSEPGKGMGCAGYRLQGVQRSSGVWVPEGFSWKSRYWRKNGTEFAEGMQ